MKWAGISAPVAFLRIPVSMTWDSRARTSVMPSLTVARMRVGLVMFAVSVISRSHRW